MKLFVVIAILLSSTQVVHAEDTMREKYRESLGDSLRNKHYVSAAAKAVGVEAVGAVICVGGMAITGVSTIADTIPGLGVIGAFGQAWDGKFNGKSLHGDAAGSEMLATIGGLFITFFTDIGVMLYRLADNRPNQLFPGTRLTYGNTKPLANIANDACGFLMGISTDTYKGFAKGSESLGYSGGANHTGGTVGVR